jgi:hypothetical protein
MCTRRFAASLLVSLAAATAAAPAGAAELAYHALPPCRIADTVGNPIAGGTTRGFAVFGPATSYAAQGGSTTGCGIPDLGGVTAVMFNFVARNPLGAGNLRAYAGDGALPTASTLNFQKLTPNLNIANGIAVPVRSTGAAGPGTDLNVFASATTEVVIDAVGYFATTGASLFGDFGGDGSDGALLVETGETFVLTDRRLELSSLTIESGGTLDTRTDFNFTYIAVSGLCDIRGTIDARGLFAHATGNTTVGDGSESYNGVGNAGAGSAAEVGDAVPFCMAGGGGGGGGAVASGIAGGQGGGSGGYGGSAVVSAPGGAGADASLSFASMALVAGLANGSGETTTDNFAALLNCMGGGGGTGGLGDTGTKGAGGGGGGVLYLECGSLNFPLGATLTAKGGNAGGSASGDDAGGGGGGGGGVILVRTRQIVTAGAAGTVNVDGGAGGAGSGTGSSGGAGGAGYWDIVKLR